MRMGYIASLGDVGLIWAVSGGISGVIELLNDSCYIIVFLGYLSLLWW